MMTEFVRTQSGFTLALPPRNGHPAELGIGWWLKRCRVRGSCRRSGGRNTGFRPRAKPESRLPRRHGWVFSTPTMSGWPRRMAERVRWREAHPDVVLSFSD